MNNQIYLLYGNEPFLIQEKKTELLSEVNQLSVSVIDMRESTIQSAIEDARTMDLFSEHKTLVIKDCYFLTGEQSKAKIEHAPEEVIEYLKNPNPSTTLIFLVAGEKLDKRKKVVKEILKHAETFEAKPLRHVQGWLEKRANKEGKTLTKEAAVYMEQQLGTDLFLLDSELTKLSLSYPKESILDIAHLEPVLSRSLESDVFKVIDRIAKRQPSALELIDDLFRLGEDPIKILLLIARQFRIMHQIKAIQEMGEQPNKVLRMSPFILQMAEEQAGLYSMAQIQQRLTECGELDVAMKRGQVEKHIALETLLVKWL